MKPKTKDILETIAALEQRLQEPGINQARNMPVKEGIKAAIKILQHRNHQPNLNRLNSVQSRAIAVLAVDYLQGNERQEVLVNIPLKKGVVK